MATKIYVGNLPYTCDEQQLKDLFGGEGRTVIDVAIITDRMTGQPRGFAFVNMATDDDAKRAIDALHGSLFGGRTLTVRDDCGDPGARDPNCGRGPHRSDRQVR